MWLKSLIIIFIFYIFGILQTSFFVHFNILGAGPNFIFILFFILVFFEDQDRYYQLIFGSIIAGLFLDVFSYSYFGVSVIILLIIAIVEKRLLYLLRERKDKYPVIYFAPLFFISFIMYHILSGVYFYLLDSSYINIGWSLLIKIIYSLVFALLGFYIYKKLIKNR